MVEAGRDSADHVSIILFRNSAYTGEHLIQVLS